MPKVYSPVHPCGFAGCSHRKAQLPARLPDVKPAGQGVQLSAPAPLNVPALHMEHNEAPAALYSPGEHDVHTPLLPPAPLAVPWM